MTAVVLTDFHPRRVRNGWTKPEAWGAHVPPGDWYAVRLDTTGTPWDVWYRPAEADGSLPVPVRRVSKVGDFAEFVGSGACWRVLAAKKAEWAVRMGRVA